MIKWFALAAIVMGLALLIAALRVNSGMRTLPQVVYMALLGCVLVAGGVVSFAVLGFLAL